MTLSPIKYNGEYGPLFVNIYLQILIHILFQPCHSKVMANILVQLLVFQILFKCQARHPNLIHIAFSFHPILIFKGLLLIVYLTFLVHIVVGDLTNILQYFMMCMFNFLNICRMYYIFLFLLL